MKQLLTHQLMLFYMNWPSEGLQSAQESKVMNNRQDSILNRPRIMGFRAEQLTSALENSPESTF